MTPALQQLLDGTPVLLRLLQPSDREAVLEAFRRLSPDSRYYRFWSRLEGVSEKLLHRFLHPEPGVHETWAALDPERPREPGYGGASYWRDSNDPSRAEISFIVADEAQHRGVGTLLFAVLWTRAAAQGITHFDGVILADNYTTIDWFRAIGAKLKFEPGQYRFLFSLDHEQLTARSQRAAQRLSVCLDRLRECEL